MSCESPRSIPFATGTCRILSVHAGCTLSVWPGGGFGASRPRLQLEYSPKEVKADQRYIKLNSLSQAGRKS